MHRRRILPSNWVSPPIITTYLQRLAEEGRENTTLAIYRGILNRLAYWLSVNAGVELLDATPDQLRAWRTSRRVDRNTIILDIQTVQGFYLWASRTGLIPTDPAWGIPKPRKRRSIPRPIPPQTLLVAIENAPDPIRAWLVLAGYAGLRACEIAGLRREDIYNATDNPYLRVWGKGGKERVVTMSPFVWDELLACGLPNRGPIFRTRTGRPYSSKDVSNRANRYLHDIGISETLHQGRHHFGTEGQAVEGDVVVLADLMGHADLETTRGYAAPSSQKARRLVDGIQPDPWPTRRVNNRR